MQKLFIVKETPTEEDVNGNISKVNMFIKEKGRIISVTPFGVHSHPGTMNNTSWNRVSGRLLVVADDGKGEITL